MRTEGKGAMGDSNDMTSSGDSAIDRAEAFVDQAKNIAEDRVRSTARGSKDSAVGMLSGVARSLSAAAQELRDQQRPGSRYIDQAANRIDRVAKYLEGTTVEELVDRTENWARRNPAVFLGGAFAIGLLGARFLKTSGTAPWREAGTTSERGARASRFADREVAVASSIEVERK